MLEAEPNQTAQKAMKPLQKHSLGGCSTDVPSKLASEVGAFHFTT